MVRRARQRLISGPCIGEERFGFRCCAIMKMIAVVTDWSRLRSPRSPQILSENGGVRICTRIYMLPGISKPFRTLFRAT